mgnify:CR=1 FL=1
MSQVEDMPQALEVANSMSLIKMVLVAALTCARTARALATTTDALLAGLAQRKAAFLGPGDDAARTVAVGNRAGDLDSIASALAVAHLTSGVALAQFARRDLALRRDASAALLRCCCRGEPCRRR